MLNSFVSTRESQCMVYFSMLGDVCPNKLMCGPKLEILLPVTVGYKKYTVFL